MFVSTYDSNPNLHDLNWNLKHLEQCKLKPSWHSKCASILNKTKLQKLRNSTSNWYRYYWDEKKIWCSSSGDISVTADFSQIVCYILESGCLGTEFIINYEYKLNLISTYKMIRCLGLSLKFELILTSPWFYKKFNLITHVVLQFLSFEYSSSIDMLKKSYKITAFRSRFHSTALLYLQPFWFKFFIRNKCHYLISYL